MSVLRRSMFSRLSAVVWLATSLASTCAAADALEPAHPTGTVTGRIIDKEGDAVAEAKLRLETERGNKSVLLSTSEADGRFAIRDVPIGCRFTVYCDVEGCGREYRDRVDVFPNRATDLGDIRVFPGCVFRGRVVDPAGQPAADVDLVVHAYSHILGHTIADCGPAWNLKTDTDGRYTTPPLPPTYVGLNVKPPPGLATDVYTYEYIVPAVREWQTADIPLVPEVPLEGIVADQFGKPIVDAEVTCRAYFPEAITTDATGRFAVRGLSAKAVHNATLIIEARGFGSYSENEPTEENPRKIVLKPCGYISGHAIDAETGEPVKIKTLGVCEVRRKADGTPYSYGCGEARFDQPHIGEFRAEVSTSGDKHLTIVADGYYYGGGYVFGFDLQTEAKDLTFKLRRAGSSATAAPQRIRGVVTRNGKPAAEVWVSLWQKRKEWNLPNAGIVRGRTVDGTYRSWAIDVLTDQNGNYMLDVSDPGEFYVVAHSSDSMAAVSPVITAAANAEQTCGLVLSPGGTISGRVLGAEPDVADRLWVVAFGHTPFQAAVPVEQNGEFTLRNVPAGEIGLKVGHDGYIDADVARHPFPKEVRDKESEPWKRAAIVTVHAGETTSGVELDYPPPGPQDRPVE